VDLARPWREYPSAADLLRATPPARDRVVDLVRGVSLVVVVFGHSFMASVVFGEELTLGNTLAETAWLQPATWLLQVMPLFFAAGAWANALSYRKADSYATWLDRRVRRLLRPAILYTACWLIASPLLLLAESEATSRLLRISTQLLWFLGAYLLVTALTPLLVRIARRPALGCAAWVAAAATIDLLRLAGAPAALGLANFVLVWALAGQCGLWAFSPTQRPPVRTAWLLVAAGLLANGLLVGLGPWPVSLVGLPGDRISNMSPPSMVLGIHCITLAALVVIAYRGLRRAAHRDAVFKPVAVINAAAMTIYLWHLVGMLLAIAAIGALGWDLPGYSTDGWGVPRLSFWTLFAGFTAGLVWVWRPFEHLPLPGWDGTARWHPLRSASPGARATVSGCGVGLIAVALLALSVTGLVGFPFGAGSSYAGFEFTPGLTIIVAAVGALLIRIAVPPGSPSDQSAPHHKESNSPRTVPPAGRRGD
jgi:fucose 4-O-acetylase-like acetyltransferase